MKLKISALAVTAAAVMGLGVSGQAAATIYGSARILIDNLTVNTFDSQDNMLVPGPEGSELFINGFTFDIANNANLDGGIGPGGSLQCVQSGINACPNVSPVLGPLISEEGDPTHLGGPGTDPGETFGYENNGGPFVSTGLDYAYAANQIDEAQLTTGNPTDTDNIVETELNSSLLASGSASIQSNTGFEYNFEVTIGQAPGYFIFEAEIDLDLLTYIDGNMAGTTASSSSVNLTFTQNTGVGAGEQVFWAPQGTPLATPDCFDLGNANLTCTKLADDEDLNVSIGTNSSGDSACFSDIRGCGTLGNNFSIRIDGLTSGEYTLVLFESKQVTISQQVPEPEILLLLGTGLIGMGIARIRRQKKRVA